MLEKKMMPTKNKQFPTIKNMTVETQQFFKSTLVTFSLTFFAYASKRSLWSNVDFFIIKVYEFIHYARRKTLTIYKLGSNKSQRRNIKEEFSNAVSKLPVLNKHKK